MINSINLKSYLNRVFVQALTNWNFKAVFDKNSGVVVASSGVGKIRAIWHLL